MDICGECKRRIEAEVGGEIPVYTIQAHPKCEACGRKGECHSVEREYGRIIKRLVPDDMLAAAYAIFESMQDTHNESQKTLTELGLPPLTRQPGSLSQRYFDWMATYEAYLGRSKA